MKQLIDKVAEFEKELAPGADMNMENFKAFLNSDGEESYLQKRNLSGPMDKEIQQRGDKKETTIAILVTFIHRYAKLYSKKVFQNSVISSLDDFSYIIVLITHESLSKTELIQKNVHEKTTGMEIIKRLIKQGLITQFNDTSDKRSQRVAITETGRVAIYSVLKELEGISTIMTGNLSDFEKNQLGDVLKKLDHFHHDIYLNDRNKSLNEIIANKVVK